LTRCRSRALQPIGAPDSKERIPPNLKEGARILIEGNALSLSGSLDVVFKNWIDVGDELAQGATSVTVCSPTTITKRAVLRHMPK